MCIRDRTDTTEQIDEKLHTEINRFTAMWKSIAEKFHCPIIQNNFEMPLYRLLGSRDAWDIHGRTNFLTRLNEAFYAYAREKDVYKRQFLASEIYRLRIPGSSRFRCDPQRA